MLRARSNLRARGFSGRSLPYDSPTLVIDFVGDSPAYSATLTADFTNETYTTYTPDGAAPDAFVNIQVWS